MDVRRQPPVEPNDTRSPTARLLTNVKKALRIRSVASVLLLSGLMGGYFHCARLQQRRPATASTGLLLLEDSDDDFRQPPFNDMVTLFGSRQEPVPKVSDLNICQTVGGCRAISVAKDTRFFAVCENAGNRIGAYELSTGRRLWSLKGESSMDEFMSATVSPSGLVYALSSHGTIYGDQILVIDGEGKIARRAAVGGFDLVLDPGRSVLWPVGKSVKKCDLDLNVLLEVTAIGWCAVSVDLDPDGSVWMAEREHPNVAGSSNRLLKISASGQMLRSVGLSFSPLCLRVDRSDGSLWVTGKAVSKSAGQRFLVSVEKRIGRLPTAKALRGFLTRPNIPEPAGTTKTERCYASSNREASPSTSIQSTARRGLRSPKRFTTILVKGSGWPSSAECHATNTSWWCLEPAAPKLL